MLHYKKKAITTRGGTKSEKLGDELNFQQPITFMAPLKECVVAPIAITKAHFLESYSKGQCNLNNVPKPKCFDNINFMIPPECYNELKRNKVVKECNELKQWDDEPRFKHLMALIRTTFALNRVCISLIYQQKVIIKYTSCLDMHEMNRQISIDSHAMLSQDYFLLLDASKDWRTMNNPLVTGIPFIKFYCGVPIFSENNETVGILSIFDPLSKLPGEFNQEKIDKLKWFSKEITKILTSPININPRIINESKINGKLEMIKNLEFNKTLTELHDLKSKLGRATSRNSSKTAFDKYISSGPYLQNNDKYFVNFANQESISNKNIMEKLTRINNFKESATFLCKNIKQNYNIDFIYILEIRISEAYKIESKYFPSNTDSLDIDKFSYVNKLVKNPLIENGITTRIIGSFGSEFSIMNFEHSIHYKSFMSEYGIKFKNAKNNTLYNNGILMPFYKYNSKLMKPTSTDNSLDISLISGGYLIGLFCQDVAMDFDEDLVSIIFHKVSVLRKIYI